MSNLLSAALDYARQGYPVFPLHNPQSGGCSCLKKADCQSIGKHPRTNNGFKDATTDAEIIKKWWTAWPDANIGIPTGQRTGWYITDQDSPEAEERIRNLVGNSCDLGTVPRSRTGRGSQLLFTFDENLGSRTDILPNLDFRGDGGYIVAPPSLHKSGKNYTWEIEPTKLLQRLPNVLVGLIRGNQQYSEKNGKDRFDTVTAMNGVPEGQRDETLFKLACKFRHENLSREFAEELILIAAQNCKPPFLDQDALKKVAHVYARYEAGRGGDFTSAYSDLSSEENFNRELNLGDLQAESINTGEPAVSFLPILGHEHFIVKGWSHLLAAYPKTGKTELLIRVIPEWSDERILYITEEPKAAWIARMQALKQEYHNVTLYLGLGATHDELLRRITDGTETIIVLDTVRNLLGLRDEKDNSEVARALIPYINATRRKEKTLIAVHHDRKGGGDHGEAIAGGHAFMGAVDIAIELKRDGHEDSPRRLLRGWGRVFEIPHLLYEMQNGILVPLGSPGEVSFNELKKRFRSAIEDGWLTTKTSY